MSEQNSSPIPTNGSQGENSSFSKGEPALPLLMAVNIPEDLRKLPVEKLPQLSTELREYLIDAVSQIGGHFGSSLGAADIAVVKKSSIVQVWRL